MKRFFKTMAFTLLGLVLSVNLWGAVTSPITLTTNSNSVGYSSQGEYTNKFDYKLTFSQLSGAGNNYIQNAKSSSFYNTVAIPGSITSIKLTDCATTSSKTDGGFTIYGGTSQANCTTKVKEISGLSNAATDQTIDFTGDYTFFKVTVNSERVLKISSIVISFSAASANPYTVTFNAGSGTCNTQSSTETSGGSGVTLPSASPSSACSTEGWTFAGWKETSAQTETTTAPTLLAAGSNYKPSANCTLYAVYSKTESGGGGTEEFNFETIANANDWKDGTAYTPVVQGAITLTTNSGGNNAKYYTSDKTWRMYNGGSLEISSSAEGVTSVTSNPSQTFSIANKKATLSFSATVKFKSITVTYGSGSTTTYTTSPECAAPKALTGIEIKTEPTKQTYTVGDDFDPSGLIITASYDDATSSEVSYAGNENMFAFEGNDISTTGNKTVTVKYTEGGDTKTDTYNITVNAKAALESISVNTDNCQTNFIKNEEFKSTGLVVTAHYVGGATKTVTSDATIDNSNYNNSNKGTYAINVSYTEESVKKETSYNVNVWELSASSSNTNLGTVGRSAYVITGNPKDGVTYANPAYTVDGSADVVQGTGANINKFTVSNVTANTTVTINFVEKAKDTYIDQMHGQLTTGNVFYDSYNAPPISYSHTTTGDNCQDDHIYFAGWTETPTQVGSSTAPADMFAAGASKTASGATYYAVWAGGEVTTFAAANTSNLTKGSGNTWTDNTTGLKLTIADGQLYTGSPKTFTVNGNSYMTISHTTKKLSMVEVTLSAAGYEINSVTPGTLSSNSTSVTSQTITNINATSVKCSAPSGTGTTSQIRATQIKVTCLSDYLTACCTPLSAPASITITEQTPNSLSFSWAEVANASGYEYKLSTATEWTTAVGRSAKIEGLAAGTKYTIQVRATDNTGVYCENGAVAEVTDVMTYYETKICISTQPTKKVYVEGDLFDKEGMVVWYTHEDKKESVSNKVTWSPSGALTTDVTEITVSYKVNDDVTLTTTQSITVKASWTMLYYINGAEYKRYCAEGDAAEVPTVAGTELEPEGFTFMGWVTASMAAESETEPSYALAKNATTYTPTKNNDKLYSVYKREEQSVRYGDALSTVYSNTTYFVGGYHANDYFYTESSIDNATVFFFDEPGQIYAYDNNVKKYISLGTSSTTSFNTTKASTDMVIGDGLTEGTIVIYRSSDASSRVLALNAGANPKRFASYTTSQQQSSSEFTKTSKSVVTGVPYYNTKAEVPAVDHIEVTAEPTKKEYFEGDKFDATGLVVWAYYSADDQVGKEVPASQYTMKIGENTDLSNYALQSTDENVTITFRNVSVNQPITVKAFALTAIGITDDPTQTKYFVGADFNPAGMVVMAYFNDERQNKTIAQATDQAPDGYTIIDGSNLQLGTDKVTISYTYREVTKTADQAITVNSALNGIRVKTNPTKMTYIEGEFFDKTGMVIEGSYGDPAEWKEVTGWTYIPTTVLKAKGDLSAAEQVKVTISYTESGTTKTIEDFYVTVNPYPKYTVTFNVNGKTDVIAPITEDTPEGGITIPANPAKIGDYTFAGWAEATMAAESPEKPAMLTETAGATYHITGNKTLYAVYTQEKVGKVQGYTYTMDIDGQGTEKTIGYFYDKDLLPVNDSHSALTLYFANGYLFYMSGNEANYVYFTNFSKADLTKSTYINQAKNYLWTEVKNDDGTYSYYCTNGTSTRYLGWNSSRWRAYDSSYKNEFTRNAVAGQQADFLMPHYTTSPSTAKTPEVKFTTTTANVNVLASENPRTLNTYKNTLSTDNEEGAVVYTLADGDDAVAEIAQDGTVTAKKAGTVTVTATVAAVTDKWFEASASYTLTFNKMTPSVQFTDPITTVYGGNTYTYVATTTSDGTVQYSMANETNATIGQTDGQLVVKEYSTITYTTKSATIYATVPETDLYKATTNSTRGSVNLTIKSNGKKQTLTFATPEGYDFAPNATVDPFINTLSGAVTEVTYSLKEGSTEGLVTVNETTGEVTVNTNLSGSATVVATAKEDNITEDGTIWAYQEATAEYTINVSYFRPVMTFTPGLVNQDEQWRGKQTVTLTAQEGDKIYYTLNGVDPTTSSTLYEAGFEISNADADDEGNLVIKAIAVSNDGAMTSPVLSKTLTVAVPTMTAKAKDVDVTDDDEIELDANDVVTLNATACKIDYRILNASSTELEKKVGSATTELTFSKGGTFTLEATPRWNVTNGFSGKTQTWIVTVKGAGHLPINFNGNNIGLAELPYFTMEGTFGSYKADNYEKTQIKIEGGTLTVSFLEEPTTLSYHLMLNGTANDGNSVVVQQSADGHSWTTIVTHCTANGNLLTTNPSKQEGARDPYQFNLNSATRYVRWTYTKVSGNIGLGSIYIGTNSLIVDDNKELDPDFRGSVIVENGGKLTIDEECAITDLTIEPGGVVHTYTNAALTVNNLYLQSADHKSCQFLIDNEDIDIEGNAYFDLTLNAAPRTWYDFAVPFKVNRNSISLANGGAMPEYDIMQYNGATRAVNGANKSAWEYVDEGDLNPGTFYMIMFASNVETIRFTKNDDAVLNNAGEVVVAEVYESSNPLDANWNGIANNTLQYANLGFLEDGNANIKAQVYHPGDKNYTTYKKDEVTFVVGAPFFVQVATYDFVDWSYPTTYNNILRAPSSEVKSVGEFTLELIANGVTYDRLFVSASEDATDSYQIGHDLAKMGVSTTVAQMWINNYNTKLCANEAVLINGQATYQMEVFVPAEGEYTIAITSAPDNAELYLTQDGQPIWNLSKGAYTTEWAKGTHNEYGLMLQVTDAKAPTNLNGLNGSDKAVKFLKNSDIYILRNAKLYNATGQLVK